MRNALPRVLACIEISSSETEHGGLAIALSFACIRRLRGNILRFVPNIRMQSKQRLHEIVRKAAITGPQSMASILDGIPPLTPSMPELLSVI